MEWSTAGATWYGHPNGAGIDGRGGCGYGDAVSKPPFSSMVAALSPFLYKAGKQCGACYHVKCTSNPSCSGKPVRVVVTDHMSTTTSHFQVKNKRSHLGNTILDGIIFSLVDTAFGALANLGEEDQLRGSKLLQIQYARVPCDYSGNTIAFRVVPWSNPYYLGLTIQFQKRNNDGGGDDVVSVDLKDASSSGPDESSEWKPMQQTWGGVWDLVSGSALRAPYSIRLRLIYSGRTLVADRVIPVGWRGGATYRALVNHL